MRKSLILPALLAVTALSVLAGPALGGSSVSVKDNFFSPGSKTVSNGTTITWRWVGNNRHNVIGSKGPAHFSSGKPKTNGSYSHKFTRKGSYTITCQLHSGMTMRVKVV